MKVNSSNINFTANPGALKSFRRAAAERFAKIDQIGEGTNIALDFLGKSIIVPTVILMTSKEDKETKEYSALKNPVAATIQLLMEVPILMAGTSYIGKLANRGALDKENGNISYNAKAAKDVFVSNLKENIETKEVLNELLEKLDKKGLSANLKDEFEQLIENSSCATKDLLKKSLKNFDDTSKRLYHLQNRVCFAAAIILTPLLCKLEDYLFPKVMKILAKNPPEENKEKQTKTGGKRISLQNFKTFVAKGGVR